MKTANFSACAPKKEKYAKLRDEMLEIDVTFKPPRCVGEILDLCLGLVISLPPVRRGYFFALWRRKCCIEKYNVSRSGYLPFFHHMLRLPGKVTPKHHSNFTKSCACHEKSPCIGGGGGGDVVMWSGQMWWGVVRCTERDVVMCCEMWWCWNFGTAKLLN